MTYDIVEDGRAIKCLICGMTSYHPMDVEKRYCGNCHLFHEDLLVARGRTFREECDHDLRFAHLVLGIAILGAVLLVMFTMD